MSATVIPFPLRRRRDLICRLAARLVALRPAAAERALRAAVDTQAATLTRRGIEPDVIEAELMAFEGAVRAMVWAYVLSPGGAA